MRGSSACPIGSIGKRWRRYSCYWCSWAVVGRRSRSSGTSWSRPVCHKRALPVDHPTRMGAVTPAAVIDGSPRYSTATAGRPLLKQLAQVLRARHYALRTEQTYVDWCHRFVRWLEGDARHTPGDYSTVGTV